MMETRASWNEEQKEGSNQRASQRQSDEERESLAIHSLTSHEWQRTTHAHKSQSKHIGRKRCTRFYMELEHGWHRDQRCTARDNADRTRHEEDEHQPRQRHTSHASILSRL
jgi:hypothetical protein